MKTSEIEQFLMRYLEATGCSILEKGHGHVTVKLSPEADKELTQRSYYWSFVERTGATPETMSYSFVFDPEVIQTQESFSTNAAAKPVPAGASGNAPGNAPDSAPGNASDSAPRNASGSAPDCAPAEAPGQNSILGRYFGFVPTMQTGRIPRDEVTFGSRRLEQIFTSVRNKGKFIRVFEQAQSLPPFDSQSRGYSSWLGINFKVEMACDIKRDEIHSIGIRLSTGEIVENFHEWMLTKKLTPRLPPNTYLLPTKITLPHAAAMLEHHLEKKLKRYDHTWAVEAKERLDEELERIEYYYRDLLLTVEIEKKQEVEEQFHSRRQEILWQYEPKIVCSVINCGLFHLSNSAVLSNSFPAKADGRNVFT